MDKRTLIILSASIAIILTVVLVVGRVKTSPREDQAIARAEVLYQNAVDLEAEDQLVQAARVYQDLKKEFPNFKRISDVEKQLWDLNMKILFSPVITEKSIVYKVEPQDTLIKIAKKYNTTVEFIVRSNNLKSDLIRPGNRFKISTAKYSVIVDKSQNSLTLKADDEVFKVYPVATGKYNSTPAGSFTIVEKLRNPDWYRGGEGVIPANSPENILGTRWLGFSEPQYGIHGGANQEDLGKQLTNGCIRMLNADVEELFAVLPRGAEVTVVE